MKESNIQQLQIRGRDCPYVYRVLQSIQFGASEEDAMVSAVLTMSGAIQSQNEAMMTILTNTVQPSIRIPMAREGAE